MIQIIIILKVIYNRVYTLLEKQNPFHNSQFGFRKNHSTSLTLQSIENKEMTIGILLDLTKAFDLVKHDILVTKLEKYDERGPAIELIKSYLTNRKQYVQIKNEKS